MLDFYCAEERMAIEIDGGIHETQKQADALRQETLESLNIRFVRVSADDVEHHLNPFFKFFRKFFDISPPPPPPPFFGGVGLGGGGAN